MIAGKAVKVSKHRALLLLGSFAYTVLLDRVYVYAISPAFGYMGYTWQPRSTTFIAASWLIALVPSFWIPIELHRPSQVVSIFLYLLVYVPSCVIPQYSTGMDSGRLLFLDLSLLLSLWLLSMFHRLPLLRLSGYRIPKGSFWLAVVALSAGSYLALFSTVGVHLRFVPFMDVYDIRMEYVQLSSRYHLAEYGIWWQLDVINPLLTAQGLVSRNPLALSIGVIGQLIIYSTTGFKSPLFSLGLMLGLFAVISLKRKRFGLYVIWGLALLIPAASLLDVLLDSIWTSSLLVRRPMVVPGLLTGYYFQFFSSNPKVWLSDSILKSFVSYPYAMSIPELIGSSYIAPGNSANANLWANAYANFGYAGIFLFTLLLGLVLWIVDSAAYHRNDQIACLLLVSAAINLSNGGLLTSLLTHGIGLSLVIIYLMPRASSGAS